MPKDYATSPAAPALAPTLSSADFAEFGRDTIAVAINSNAALSAGLEAFGREAALYAQAAFQSAGETARGLLGARTFEDVVRLQTDFVRRSFDGFVERSTKLSELGCSLIGAGVDAWGERAKG